MHGANLKPALAELGGHDPVGQDSVGLGVDASRAADAPHHRFDDGDAYFTALSHDWSKGTREVFRQLPELSW